MKKAILAVVLGGVALGAMAQETPWQLRARAVHINPADKSDPIAGVGPSDLITVSSKTIPEVDISYFLTPNISAELVLTYPQKHDVYLDGASIGTFKHLPPTLLAQYHFTPSSPFSPYVGVGVNWTTFSKNKILGGQGSLEHDSLGLALQAGVDYKLDKNWSLNLDIKKVQIRSDVMLAGVKVSKVKVDPVLLGVGVGYRF
ncbi:outer membrane protein [Duganella sp. CF458]|uniref:OmpW/AlkL family protein n=1 Tax=Duganella sp. CF458 TaxID=1884368 RepID=UPI0008E83593|nr:OmpW family outer membrane protein [Duganella sp. CF458]SFF63821.1 outer membrane protein [Duganella sp. CF458]